jgi:hypothetical protein
MATRQEICWRFIVSISPSIRMLEGLQSGKLDHECFTEERCEVREKFLLEFARQQSSGQHQEKKTEGR